MIAGQTVAAAMQRSSSSSSLSSSMGSLGCKSPSLRRSSSSSSLSSNVSKVMKYFDRGISGVKHATSDKDVTQEEVGEWRYLVIDAGGIRPRGDASYTDGAKRRDCPRIREGTIVEVDRRRRSGWTQWLWLKSGDGWLFDVSPKDKTVRLLEVEVFDGQWQYESLVHVPLLGYPCPRAASSMTKKLGYNCLHPSTTINVDQRVRPLQMKGTFLRLTNRQGWALDFAEGRQLMRRVGGDQGPSSPKALSIAGPDSPGQQGPEVEEGSWDYVVVDHGGVSLRRAPNYSSQKLPNRLEEGQLVSVQRRSPADGTTFLHVAEPPGWAFDLQPGGHSRLRMMQVEVEKGLWYYVVAHASGVSLRSRCTHSEHAKLSQRFEQGSFLSVLERVKIGDSTFLRVKGGWVFDQRSGKQMVLGPIEVVKPPQGTMMQVEAERPFAVTKPPGAWDHGHTGLRYRCSPCSTDMDPVMHAPWGSVVLGHPVAEDWLKVGDRFLPFKANGSQVLKAQPPQSGVHLASEPTDAPWAATKYLVLNRALLQVTLTCALGGRRWARVASINGSMEGWMHERLLREVNGPAQEH